MSDLTQVLQHSEDKEDDCWSDIDESILARCEQIESEEFANTKKSWNENKKGISTTDVHGLGNEVMISESSQVLDKDTVSPDLSPPQDVQDNDSDVVKIVRCSELGEMTPLQFFSKGAYLCVTDLTQQLWCEQHMCYNLMGVEPPSSMSQDTDLPLPLPTADRPEVKAGKSVHLARELEVHDVVSVSITSSADKWGLHVLNLLISVRAFLVGTTIAREVPIFGDPLGNGDLVFGIIDELQFNPESYCVSLTELKTRKMKRLPGKAQKQQHALQVRRAL
ncbi:hypothetical protein ACOMHN_018861 [Nucella lapillus]